MQIQSMFSEFAINNWKQQDNKKSLFKRKKVFKMQSLKGLRKLKF